MFNALKYTNIMERAGFTKEQAETSLRILIEIMDQNFASKTDIQLSETNIRSDMKEMESSIRGDMKEMESSIRGDMKEMESSIRNDMKEMEHRLQIQINSLSSEIKSMADKTTIRLSGVMVVCFSLFTALQKLL